ncbi:MAG: hypothetical protein Kow0027_16780 [Saprospiraceae bacterium]
MNVHKLISKLKRLFKNIDNRLQPVTRPVKKLAQYTWWFMYPPNDKDGNIILDKAILEKSIFAVSLLSVAWVAVMCYQVASESHHQNASLVPEFALNINPEPQPIDISDNLKQLVLEAFSSQKVADENSLELRRQVLEHMESLEAKPDGGLSTREFIEKYNSLCLSSILLSKLSSSRGKQRLWSSIAINHAEKALAALPKTNLTIQQFQEINLNRFMAMALNYYQRGSTTDEQLKAVFKMLDKQYIMNSGYSQTYLFQALADDGIIALPSYTRLKNS